MINKFRELNKTVAYIIFVAIACSFAFFGLGGLLTTSARKPVIEVNGHEISEMMIQRAQQNTLAQFIQRYKQRPTPEQMALLQNETIKQLVNEQLFISTAYSLGLDASKQTINHQIISDPALHTNGKFDQDKYRTFIERAGLTEFDLFSAYTQDRIMSQFFGSVKNTSFVTPSESSQLSHLASLTADTLVIHMPLSTIRAKSISNNDIQSYYDSHQAEFMTPELATIEWITVSLADFVKDVIPTSEQVTAYYESHQSQFTKPRYVATQTVQLTPEQALHYKSISKRQFKQINELLAALSKDASSVMTGNLVSTDPAFNDVVINSHMIRPHGEAYELIWVSDIHTQKISPLESVRDAIVAQIKQDDGMRRYQEALDALSDLSYAEGEGLLQTSKELNIRLHHARFFEDSRNPEGISDDIDMKSLIFSDDRLSHNSDVIKGDESAFVFYIQSMTPPKVQPYAEVQSTIKKKILNDYRLSLAPKRLQQHIDKIVSFSSVTDLEQYAKRHGLAIRSKKKLKYDQALTEQEMILLFSPARSNKFNAVPDDNHHDILVSVSTNISKSKHASDDLLADFELQSNLSDMLRQADIIDHRS